MTQEEFKKLQLVQVEIMDEIHRICIENGITYYMIGGTALGAVRHRGFIPWDLDMDIAMTRENYDRFKEICATELNPRFLYRDYTNTSKFAHPHALLCIKNTFLEIKFDKYNPDTENLGIYLDIFPLDNAPADEKLQQKQADRLNRIKNMKKYKLATLYQNSTVKKICKKTVSALMFWTSVDEINKKMDACMRQYDSEPTGYLCSMASHYSYKKQCMPQEIYGTPQLLEFEGREYYGPQNVDEYLTRIYKDYMKLPSKDEQKQNLAVFEKVIFDE